MRDYSNASEERRKNPNWKRYHATSSGITLNEGDYYLTRDGRIVYLMDNLVLSLWGPPDKHRGERPFYIREKDTRKMLGGITWEGNIIDGVECGPDIVAVYERPSLTSANEI